MRMDVADLSQSTASDCQVRAARRPKRRSFRPMRGTLYGNDAGQTGCVDEGVR